MDNEPAPFTDGDDLHSERNRALMAAGTARTDDDRLPWLHADKQRLVGGAAQRIVVACSALRRSYRDLLREYAPSAVFVHPYGPRELASAAATYTNESRIRAYQQD